MSRRLVACLLCLALSLVVGAAFAQWTVPSLRASLDSADVAVGEPFTLTLSATVQSGAPSPSDPRLSPPAGLSASGPSISTQTSISIVNGRVTQSTGFSATFRLVASREGTYRIPGPSIAWNGSRISTTPLTVTVHSGPPRRAPSRPNPFDPFGMFGQLPNLFDTPQPQAPSAPEAPPELHLDVAPDPTVFLRAIADKTTAVVGEQVTLTTWLYSRGRIDWTDVHEPALADFLRRDLLSPTAEPEVRGLLIGGVPWRAQAVFRSAIFPLRTGDLDVGVERASILGAGHGSGARGGVLRESQPLRIHVGEPPAQGRPPGYQVGDVGRYALSATVEPRAIEQGGAVAVTVTLSGTGNVPNAVRLPVQTGVEWLDPQTHESFDVNEGKVRGSRTLTYLVRVKTKGTLDLGEVTLPYWDPDRRAYDVARASLGSVAVTPSHGVQASEPVGPRDPFAGIAGVRKALGPVDAAARPFTDSRWFWLGIFGAPLAVAVGSAGLHGVGSLRRKLAERKASPEAALDRALAEARAARAAGDARGAAAAIDRAMYVSIEAATGLKARALMLDEVPDALTARGVDDALAARVREVLGGTEAVRFLPDEAPPLDRLIDEARAIGRELRRAARGG